MTKYSKREKKLIAAVVVLSVVVGVFAIEILGPKLSSNTLPGTSSPPSPPTMEESIKNADIIFSCLYEDTGESIDCRINKIYAQRNGYNFPHAVGDVYPRNSYPKNSKKEYGDGAIIFITPRHRVSWSSVEVYDGIIPGFNNIYLDEFQRIIESKTN